MKWVIKISSKNNEKEFKFVDEIRERGREGRRFYVRNIRRQWQEGVIDINLGDCFEGKGRGRGRRSREVY